MSNTRFFGEAKIDNDRRNVLILTPFIKTSKHMPVDEIDFEHSLVVDLDSINNDVGEQLSTMANNYHAGEFKTAMDYLEGKSLRNSDRVLTWLHSNGQIKRVPARDIVMRGSNYTVYDVNQIIRKDMLDHQPARDVDDARREQAQIYNEQLNESSKYPDFNNPSEQLTPVPNDTAEMASSVSPQPLNVMSVDDVKRIHDGLIQAHVDSQDKLTSALQVANQLKDTLSDSAIEKLSSDLKSITASSDTKQALIEALANHYEHVDVDYITKNLDAAERRKSKDSK